MEHVLNGKRQYDGICWAIATSVILIVILFFNFTYTKFYVVGASMEGTICGASDYSSGGGDYVYIFNAEPHRGDIVVVDVGEKYIIKRVIGVGGDTVELIGGVLYLNDQEKAEPYVSAEHNDPTKNNYGKVQVKAGYLFLMGDNRNLSLDSRSDVYGQISVDSVVGVVADWSMTYKEAITDINTFFDFTLPSYFKIN